MLKAAQSGLWSSTLKLYTITFHIACDFFFRCIRTSSTASSMPLLGRCLSAKPSVSRKRGNHFFSSLSCTYFCTSSRQGVGGLSSRSFPQPPPASITWIHSATPVDVRQSVVMIGLQGMLLGKKTGRTGLEIQVAVLPEQKRVWASCCSKFPSGGLFFVLFFVWPFCWYSDLSFTPYPNVQTAFA